MRKKETQDKSNATDSILQPTGDFHLCNVTGDLQFRVLLDSMQIIGEKNCDVNDLNPNLKLLRVVNLHTALPLPILLKYH